MIEWLKNGLMLIVTIATYVSFIPQIAQIIRTKRSEDISTSSWTLWFLSSLAYLLFSLLEGGFGLILSSVSEFILTAAVLLLTLHYKRNKSSS